MVLLGRVSAAGSVKLPGKTIALQQGDFCQFSPLVSRRRVCCGERAGTVFLLLASSVCPCAVSFPRCLWCDSPAACSDPGQWAECGPVETGRPFLVQSQLTLSAAETGWQLYALFFF